MKSAACLLVALAALVGCSGDSPGVRSKIEECIADGGTPQYTANKYGELRSYLGCVMP